MVLSYPRLTLLNDPCFICLIVPDVQLYVYHPPTALVGFARSARTICRGHICVEVATTSRPAWHETFTSSTPTNKMRAARLHLAQL